MYTSILAAQFQLNIPFGDCFSVEGRFDIRPNADNPEHADIEFHAHVAFKKSTMMKGKIETNTLATYKKNFPSMEDAVCELGGFDGPVMLHQ